MKLLEFFSKNENIDDDDKTDNDIKKDVMGFILDDDDIFKQHMLPLIHKMKSGKTVDEKDYKELVNDGCIKFYKEKEFSIDPNKLFPSSMRKQIAKELHSINKKNLENDK